MFVRRLYNLPTWNVDYDPFNELERMRTQMDRLFEGMGGDRARRAGVFPLINVTEDKDNYRIRAELPGIKADELDISITGNSISLSGERKIPEEDRNAKYHRREREAGTFQRMVSLPGDVEVEKVEAKCADGVLTVVLPKAEAAKPRQITVK